MSFRRTVLNEIYDFIADYCIATTEEIQLVTHINDCRKKCVRGLCY